MISLGISEEILFRRSNTDLYYNLEYVAKIKKIVVLEHITPIIVATDTSSKILIEKMLVDFSEQGYAFQKIVTLNDIIKQEIKLDYLISLQQEYTSENYELLTIDGATSLFESKKGKDEGRKANIERKTSETAISIAIDLDGNGHSSISTGLAFFDHMLEQLSRHGNIDLDIKVEGDLHIDEHHTIEDTALALGTAFLQSLGDKKGIERYGFLLPMDDCLAQVAIDFGGRPWLVWDADFKREKIGEMPTEMFMHFFKSFSDNAKCNLNIQASGINEHHKIEAIFKAFAKAIKMAVAKTGMDTIPSTKGNIMIAILDYSGGNIMSVQNALTSLGVASFVTANADEINKADKLIFPGVGEAASAMHSLQDSGMDKLLPELKIPVLGICLGMQLMCASSEENNTSCLNIFKDVPVKQFPAHDIVPHMGWNNCTSDNNSLFKNIDAETDLYFVHSYYAPVNEYTIATTNYILPFSAAMQYKNFYATQFHPEKSAKAGMQILKNFIDL